MSLQCPSGAEATSIGGQPVTVAFATPTALGGTGLVTVACTPGSGTFFPAGTTSVTCTATDAGGRVSACAFPVTVKVVPTLTRVRFMAFGDSLTEGKLAVTADLLIDSPAHSYPAHLIRLLTERYTSQTPTLINEGLGGEKVEDSGSRLRGLLQQHRPEVVLVLHGVNDLNESDPDDLQDAIDGIEELVNEGRFAGASVFVATLPPLSGPKASCPECVEPFNAELRRMVPSRGGTIVEVHGAFGSRTDLMGADGIHPTPAGYETIATAFFEAIRRVLEGPVPQ